jgi:hypothetical protein
MFIDDGSGHGYQVKVDSNNRVHSFSITEPAYSNISISDSQLFTFTSTYAATANDFVMYILNSNSTLPMRINRIIVSSTVATLWTIIRVTGGTPAGTAITGINQNFSSGIGATVTSLGNAAVTGSPTGTNLFLFHTPASTAQILLVEGSIVMPINTAIAIKAGATGTVAVTTTCYWGNN